MDKEVEKDYNEFWKPIVEDENGNISFEQVKKELYDYHQMIKSVEKVYCHITNDRISKPNTDPDVVCRVADDTIEEFISVEIRLLKEYVIRSIDFYE